MSEDEGVKAVRAYYEKHIEDRDAKIAELVWRLEHCEENRDIQENAWCVLQQKIDHDKKLILSVANEIEERMNEYPVQYYLRKHLKSIIKRLKEV